MIAPTPYFSDRGCHVRIYEEARALRERGHEVHICTYHLGRDIGEIPAERIPFIPWYTKKSAGPSWHKPYLDLLLFFKALRLAWRIRPDLLHCHLHEGAFIGYLLKKILGRPLLFDCQGSLTGELVDHGFVRRGTILFRFFYILERWINAAADHVVTSSTPTAELLNRDFALPRDRITPIIDGIGGTPSRNQVRASDLGRALGLPQGKRIVIYLGAMTEYQGVDLLLEVVKGMEHREDMHFLLMGYPEEGYVRKAAALGVASRVTFTGKIDYMRVNDYLSLGDMAVSPKLSRTEANGKLLNYMACGLPSVVFDTPVNREILGEVGLYARFGDADDFVAKIEALLDDSAELERLSKEVRAKAERDHAWTTRVENMVAVYRTLCEAG